MPRTYVFTRYGGPEAGPSRRPVAVRAVEAARAVDVGVPNANGAGVAR